MDVSLLWAWSGSFGSGGGSLNQAVGGDGIPAGDVLIAKSFVHSGGGSYSDSQGNTWETKGGFAYCLVTNPLGPADTVICTVSRTGGGTTPGRGAVAHVSNPSWGEDLLVQEYIDGGASDSTDWIGIPTSPPFTKRLIMAWQLDSHGTQVGDQVALAFLPAGFTELTAGETTGAWDIANRLAYKIVTAGATPNNLLPENTSGIEVSAADWEGYQLGTVERSTAQAYSGDASLKVTTGASSAPGAKLKAASQLAVTPGQMYEASAWFFSNLAFPWGRGLSLDVDWYTAGGVLISTSFGPQDETFTIGSWVEVVGAYLAPATAAFARPFASTAQHSAGEVFYLDDFAWRPQTFYEFTADSLWDLDDGSTSNNISNLSSFSPSFEYEAPLGVRGLGLLTATPAPILVGPSGEVLA